MAKLIIPGTRDESLKNKKLPTGQFMDVEIREGIDLTASRGSGARETLSSIKEDDILELMLEDGSSWFGTLEDYKKQFAPSTKRGARGTEEVFIGPSLSGGDTSRGLLGNLAIKAVRILGIDTVQIAADAFIKKIEGQLCDVPGLYRCPDPNQSLFPLEEELNVAVGPYLLLIHGTGSCTTGSFGGFTSDGISGTWHNLENIYGDRILAYEHKTVSMSPLENVLELLQSLPEGIQLHVVSHSRGGLVGEILARGAAKKQLTFSKEDIALFEEDDKDRKRDVEAMKKLNQLFDEKRITVERFVRVACPTAGTLLASKRLDRYLNVLVNILGRIPGMAGNPFYEFVTSWLLATIKKRTDPNDLPGVEAMMPSSPLIRVLNNPTTEIDSPLAVLAGDVRRGGFKRTMMVLASNLYYRSKHDFVVNTAAMYRGTPRPSDKAFYFYDEGDAVDHFHYFINQKTRNALEAALQGKTTPEFGFHPLLWSEGVPSLPSSVRSGMNKPVVYILPGIMGSHLSINNKKIWVKLFALASGRMNELTIDNEEVEASSLVERAYANIVDYLSSSHDVITFPYDWRKSLFEEADRLAEHIKQTISETNQPVRILAHSMGGLLARVMMAKNGSPWQKLVEERPGSRFIMLGTPNGGSHAIGRVLCGREKIFRVLHLLDIRNNQKAILNIIAKYPGLLQLLPNETYDHIDGINFFNLNTWKVLKKLSDDRLELPDEQLLQEGKKLGTTLKNNPVDPAYTFYIAGRAQTTPFALRKTDEGTYRFIGTSRGDGRVPWDSGIPDELKEGNTFYLDTEHGSLANYKPGFPAILDLLEKGETDKNDVLGRDAIALRGDDVEVELPDEDPVLYPDEYELEAIMLGYDPTRETEVSTSKIKITMTHGDLGNAMFPVAVGHFKGDGIVSAERVLDSYLDNKLSERHRMGIYPGEIETSEIILDPKEDPPGALIIGLGTYGDLTSGDLTRSFAHAALSMAIKQREEDMRTKKQGAPRPNRISALLIGSGYAGLDMRTGIRAMLNGIQAANIRIKAMGLPDMPLIDEIEFIEVYQNRAVQAAKILHKLMQEDQFGKDFILASSYLKNVGGGFKRVQYDDNSSWWHRIKVESVVEEKTYHNELAPEEEARKVTIRHLKFTSLTDRARGEEVNQPDHRRLVDSMIERSIHYTDWDPDAAQAMFELLLPNHFKDYASERKNILWIVDEESAHYPWELLMDPSRGEQEEPMAVQAGMLRQLTTTEFRTEVDMTPERRALVIGDPISNFPKLPAAVNEAKMVKNLLMANDFEVVHSIEEYATSVLKKIFKQRYQIVHIAAHGEFDPYDPSKTGVVIGDHDFLTPGIMRQLRWVPDMVFINCCHLGAIDAAAEQRNTQVHKLAANLGTQLIRMGVRAVVVAGWAVNDAAADLFAKTFYREMFEGNYFGYAIQAARKSAHDKYRQNITWGAYQAYGDPFFTIRKYRKSGDDYKKEYCDPMEAIIDIENVISRANSAYGRKQKWVLEELELTIDSIPKEWMNRAEIVEKIARAYTDLGMIQKGIQYYELAYHLDKANYTVAGLEQLANLRARGAIRIVNEALESNAGEVPKQVKRQAEKQIDQAIEELNRLNEFVVTTGRLNLLGSAYKRKALFLQLTRGDDETVKTNKKVWQALHKSATYYKKALDLRKEQTGAMDHYPLLNWLAAAALLEWLLPEAAIDGQETSDKPMADMPDIKVIENELAAAYKDAQVRDESRPTFWEYSAMATFDIFYLLLKDRKGLTKPGDNQQLIDKAVRSYQKAWDRSGSKIMRSSVKEHKEFIIQMLDPVLLDNVFKKRNKANRVKEIEARREAMRSLLNQLMSVMS